MKNAHGANSAPVPARQGMPDVLRYALDRLSIRAGRNLPLASEILATQPPYQPLPAWDRPWAAK